MTRRPIITMLLLTFLTFGIYGIYWFSQTKREMVRTGADIPTTWLLLIPVVGFYYLWRYSAGVEQVTQGKYSQAVSFLLLACLGVIGLAILQESFNKLSSPALAPSV